MDLSLTEAALRVLTAYTTHHPPAPADVETLQAHALPEDVGVPLDELARQIVLREIQKSRQDKVLRAAS